MSCPNHAYIYADYVSQEIAIAAYLSKDEKLIKLTKKAMFILYSEVSGSCPADATKKTHKKERNEYKIATLATFYGQGHKSLAARLMISEAKAIELIANIKNIYSTYFGWVNGLVELCSRLYFTKMVGNFGLQMSIRLTLELYLISQSKLWQRNAAFRYSKFN